jgi:hypothetical protein
MLNLVPYLMASTSVAILLLNRIRLATGLLLAQYFLAFLISLPVLPVRTLAARLIGGILVCVILFTSDRRFRGGGTFQQSESLPRSFWFRLITSLIVFIVAWAFANQNQASQPILARYVFLGAIFNICFGTLMLGLYQSPLEATIGLLTLLIGFDLFYGSVEPSLAIVVLMISIQLIISLATSYIMSITYLSRKPTKGLS